MSRHDDPQLVTIRMLADELGVPQQAISAVLLRLPVGGRAGLHGPYYFTPDEADRLRDAVRKRLKRRRPRSILKGPGK